jgi:pilus assembly protein CpaE
MGTYVTRIAAIVRSEASGQELRMAASSLAIARFDLLIEQPANFVTLAGRLPRSDVLLVEVHLGDQGDAEALKALIASPLLDRPVIAITHGASLAGVRDLMRHGIVDFVPHPVSAGDLASALDAADRRIAPSRRQKGQLISFMRSCGGAGATTLAQQTAIELAQRDRKQPARVCLIDLDLQFGNLAISLDQENSGGLSTLIQSPAVRIDDDFFAGTLARHETGVSLLSAPPQIIPLEALTSERLDDIVALARASFDYIIVDLPHAWTTWLPQLLGQSDLITLVMPPTITGVFRARRHLELIEDQGLGDVPLKVVVNGMDWHFGWRGRIREIQQALKHQISHVVRADAKTAEMARERGEPLRSVKRNSVIERDVRAFVESTVTKAGRVEPTLAPQLQAAE